MATALAGARLQQLEVVEALCNCMEGVMGSAGARLGRCGLKVSRFERIFGSLPLLTAWEEWNMV